MRFLFPWCFAAIILSCEAPPPPVDLQAEKDAILRTEKQFGQMAQTAGVAAAFYEYADSNAVIMRGNNLVKGKHGIRKWCADNMPENAELSWTPSFVDVASSGDLGYTYGNYTFAVLDSAGEKQESSGIFHTVWKKQTDGSWKFVWD